MWGYRSRLKRARSDPCAHRCYSRHILRPRRGLGPRVGCGGIGRLRCSLRFRVRRRGPAPHFARGRFIDQGRVANHISGLPRSSFVVHRMPLPIFATTFRWWDSLYGLVSRHTKRSAKLEAVTTDSSGLGPKLFAGPRSCRNACSIAVIQFFECLAIFRSVAVTATRAAGTSAPSPPRAFASRATSPPRAFASRATPVSTFL
jgi:hypothetical protein